MFDRFKSTHGGEGPFQALGDRFTGGLFARSVHRDAVQQQWTDTFDSIDADPNLSDDFKKQAAQMRRGFYDVPDALKILGQVQEGAAQQRDINDAFAPVGANLVKLADKADNDLDRDQVVGFGADLDTARKLALNPTTRQTGLDMLKSIADGVQKYTAANETQRIALGDTNFKNRQQIYADLKGDSAPFVQVQQGYQALQALAQQKPTPQSDQALMLAALRVINPNVIVRAGTDPGDDYWNGLPGGIGQLAKYVVTGGAGMTAEERQVLLNVAQTRVIQENAAQTDRNTRATALGKAANLPDNLIDSIPLPLIAVQGPLQAEKTTAPPPPRPTTRPDGTPWVPYTKPIPSQTDSTGEMIGGAVVDSLKDFGSNAWEVAKGLAAGAGVRIRPGSVIDRLSERPTDEYKTQGGW